MLTGNYNWFNLLTMLLCLFLFDDRRCARVLPKVSLAAPKTIGATHPDAAATMLATL